MIHTAYVDCSRGVPAVVEIGVPANLEQGFRSGDECVFLDRRGRFSSSGSKALLSHDGNEGNTVLSLHDLYRVDFLSCLYVWCE